MSNYQYAVKNWVDFEIILVLFFLVFASKGYEIATGITVLLLAAVSVVSMVKLNRSRNRA